MCSSDLGARASGHQDHRAGERAEEGVDRADARRSPDFHAQPGARAGHEAHRSVWQKGDKYYYFDNLGISQLIDNAIYEITDMRTLEELRSSQNDGVIKELIEDEKLIKVEGEKKIKIVEKYKGNWDYFMIFFILCIFIVPTIFNACKKIISSVDRKSVV